MSIPMKQLRETRRKLLSQLELEQARHADIDLQHRMAGEKLNRTNEQIRSLDRMILAFAEPVPVGYKTPVKK